MRRLITIGEGSVTRRQGIGWWRQAGQTVGRREPSHGSRIESRQVEDGGSECRRRRRGRLQAGRHGLGARHAIAFVAVAARRIVHRAALERRRARGRRRRNGRKSAGEHGKAAQQGGKEADTPHAARMARRPASANRPAGHVRGIRARPGRRFHRKGVGHRAQPPRPAFPPAGAQHFPSRPCQGVLSMASFPERSPCGKTVSGQMTITRATARGRAGSHNRREADLSPM